MPVKVAPTTRFSRSTTIGLLKTGSRNSSPTAGRRGTPLPLSILLLRTSRDLSPFGQKSKWGLFQRRLRNFALKLTQSEKMLPIRISGNAWDPWRRSLRNFYTKKRFIENSVPESTGLAKETKTRPISISQPLPVAKGTLSNASGSLTIPLLPIRRNWSIISQGTLRSSSPLLAQELRRSVILQTWSIKGSHKPQTAILTPFLLLKRSERLFSTCILPRHWDPMVSLPSFSKNYGILLGTRLLELP